MVVKGKQRSILNTRKHSFSYESLRGKQPADGVDLDYENHLLHEFGEDLRPESSRKRREDSEHDYDDDEEEKEKDDPDLMLFLGGLEVDGKSYRFEHTMNGCCSVIKYEGASNSGTESDEEPRKRLRSAMKQKDGPVSQIPHLENLDSHHTLALKGDLCLDEVSDQERRETRSGAKQNKDMKTHTRRRLRKKSKIEKDDDIINMDRDYYIFSKYYKVVNDHIEFNNGTHKVEYELKMIQVKEEREDVSYSDVEIIDRTAFYRSISNEDTTEQSEFKRMVIAALRKPFDREEYKKLRQDIKHHKAKLRHIDLRDGREKTIGTQEDGKSYLDYCPGFNKKFAKAKGDKPKRLNLLRGFFLWIKTCDKFCPWMDDECLAVIPGSGNDDL